MPQQQRARGKLQPQNLSSKTALHTETRLYCPLSVLRLLGPTQGSSPNVSLLLAISCLTPFSHAVLLTLHSPDLFL